MRTPLRSSRFLRGCAGAPRTARCFGRALGAALGDRDNSVIHVRQPSSVSYTLDASDVEPSPLRGLIAGLRVLGYVPAALSALLRVAVLARLA